MALPQHILKNLVPPTDDQDAATKKYVDDTVGGGGKVDRTGDTMTGQLTISPAGVTALRADGNIIIRLGSKFIFDG